MREYTSTFNLPTFNLPTFNLQLPMLNCPRCHRPIDPQVVTCPHCGAILKAYGHPGISLHRAVGDKPLCESCTYHADDSCTFPQRPYAKECTLYNDINKPQLENQTYIPRRNLLQWLGFWYRRNPTLISLLVLVAVSVLLTLIAASR